MIQKLKTNHINGFLQLDSIALENFDAEHEQTSDQKLQKRKYWFICQKISEARLIGYQDNTPTHINDLITEKAKDPKKFRYGFVWVHRK